MATLNLDRVWVNRWDTGQAVSGHSTGRGRMRGMEGEVRRYAGGRQRSFTAAGLHGTFAFTLRQVSLATIDLLETWVGLPVQVRDHRGQRFVGVFYAVVPAEVGVKEWDVALELHTVTVVEGV